MGTLALLPGMDGTGLLFADFVAALGAQVETQVLRYPPDQILGYAELETRVRAALPTDRPLVLLGESFSGPIAISIAATPPPNLRGLILCCTFARFPLPAGIKALAKLLPTPRHTSPKWVGRYLFGQRQSPHLLALLDAAMCEVDPAVRHARLCAIMTVDVTDKLARINMPTLYLRAAEDRVVPRAASELILQKLPCTELVEFPAPHGLLQTMPNEAAVTVREFALRVTAVNAPRRNG